MSRFHYFTVRSNDNTSPSYVIVLAKDEADASPQQRRPANGIET